MKIVALTHYYIEENRAGGEMMLHRILKELAKEHDVTALITDTVRFNTVIDGVKVIYGANRNTLETYDYDMVVSQFANAPLAIKSAHDRGKQACLIVHNDHPTTLLHASSLLPSDIAIFNTDWIRAKSNTRAKALVIHPPIEPKDFKTKPGEFVTLVNLIPEKGSTVFYQLAEKLPDTKFLAVGGGYYKERQRVINLPNVTHAENTADMKNDVYAKSKIVLMPSTYESYGMVAAEAICSGIPVICTPTAGLRENLGDAGIYVNVDDIQGYIDAITALDDQAAYKKASKLSLERSKQKDSHAEIQKLLELLK